jgi:hypothetical protein
MLVTGNTADTASVQYLAFSSIESQHMLSSMMLQVSVMRSLHTQQRKPFADQLISIDGSSLPQVHNTHGNLK